VSEPADETIRLPPFVIAAALLAVAAGVVMRFTAPGPLWLDEAQTLSIIDSGVGQLASQLRTDGHPPLYYVLLIGWTNLFGTGDVAVRSMSGLFSVGALGLVWIIAAKRHSRLVAGLAVVVLATNPFAIRYATETRMYALFTLLALGLWLAADRLAQRKTPARVAAVVSISAALLLTHYWAMFVLAAGFLLAARLWQRGQLAMRPVALSMAAGGLFLGPWVPVLLHQLQHTGTPWATTPSPPSIALSVIADLGGGRDQNLAVLLSALLLSLAIIGLTSVGGPHLWSLSLDLRIAKHSRQWAWLTGASLMLGAAVVLVTRGGFASRYAAGVLGFVVILIALGLGSFRPGGLMLALTASVAVLGLAVAGLELRNDRTQAGEIAIALAVAGPNDVVVVCPDQLGPSLARAAPDISVIAYPTLAGAAQVDWTDYEERNAAADPGRIAEQLAQRVSDNGGHVWLVSSGGYRTFGVQCEQLEAELSVRLGPGQTIIAPDGNVFEPARLSVLPQL